MPPAVQATLDQQFNASQRAAVTAGLEANARLVLVQGPPGGLVIPSVASPATESPQSFAQKHAVPL